MDERDYKAMNAELKNQTAVEWFYQRILAKDIKSIFKEAKEMEKQQLCYFYVKGAEAEINNPYVTNIEFYNKTFKK
jgi:hypothetical protein